MLDTILPAYPDEALYSWLARMKSYCGFNLYEEYMTCDCFTSKKPNTYFSLELDNLIKLLEFDKSCLFNNTENIINKMTVVPFYKAFLSDKAKLSINYDLSREYRETIANRRIKKILGITLFEDKLKLCPCCYLEDKKYYGQAYWHREHMVQGNYICYKHNEVLLNLDYTNLYYKNDLMDINKINFDQFEKCLLDDIPKNIYYEISKYVNVIFNGDFSNLNITEIKKNLYKELKKNYVDYDDVNNWYSIKECYFNNWLNEFRINKNNSDYNYRIIFSQIFNIESTYIINPIFYLHHIYLLFGSIDEFIKFTKVLE